MSTINHEDPDDNAKIEITDLDNTTHGRTFHELHFSPRMRVWMIIVTLVSVVLFLSFTFGNQLYSLVYKPALPKIALNANPSSVALKDVMNGVVYAVDPEQMVYAIRASNGSLIWQSFHPDINQSTSSNGVTYTITPSGKMSATRTADNSLLWSHQFPLTFASAPTVVANEVYEITPAGTVYALDAASGDMLWQYKLSIPAAQPVLAAGEFVYVNAFDGTLYTFLAKSGKLLWHRQLPVAAQVLTTNESIIYASDSNVTALRSSNGSLLWHLHYSSTPVQPLAMTHGNIYVATFDSNVSAFNASNGAFLWHHKLPALAYEPIAASDAVIQIHASNYAIYTLNAVTGAFLWFKTDILTFVVVQENMYIVTLNNDIEAFDAKGALLWHRQLSSRFIQPLLVANDVLYTGTSTGIVYALRTSDSSVLWRYATQVQ
ncbi:MAG: PQQ-binding-like beta-propeller repeat protein [Ktedonobacteraceae bacterium]|nr:PQQ-binding-like beta-propeller repeat protein [Ktedonobacteraceae bacterium]